jgi:hypothetical protein
VLKSIFRILGLLTIVAGLALVVLVYTGWNPLMGQMEGSSAKEPDRGLGDLPTLADTGGDSAGGQARSRA